MCTYAMTDIHGCYDEFQKMLELIQFSENDQLIITGDYIDRGKQNYEMLRWIEYVPENIVLLKGNHDAEFAYSIKLLLSFIDSLNIDMDKLRSRELLAAYAFIKSRISTSVFDQYETLKELISNYDLTVYDLKNWKECIDAMPYYYEKSIDTENYIFVHAGFITEEAFQKVAKGYPTIEAFYLYSREDAVLHNGLKDVTVVFGHTPTISSGLYYNDGKIFELIDKKNKVHYYNLDCGIVYQLKQKSNARLACLRLEDKQKFYIEADGE